MLLADYESYIRCQEKASETYAVSLMFICRVYLLWIVHHLPTPDILLGDFNTNYPMLSYSCQILNGNLIEQLLLSHPLVLLDDITHTITLPSPIKFLPSPKLAITISDSFVVSVLTLIPTQLAPLPPPSFTPDSITVILSTTTYLSLRSPTSNRSRTLLPVLLLKLLNAVTSLLSYTLFIGSK